MMAKAGIMQRIDRRHLVWLLPIVCAVWVGRLMYLRRGPECFLAPGTGIFSIHDGRLYWVSGYPVLARPVAGKPARTRTYGPSILTQPVTGGPIREVVREDAKYQITGNLTFWKDSILYSMYPGGSMGGGSKGGIKFLGTYRTATSKPTSQQAVREKRTIWPRSKLPAPWVVRHRVVPAQGGAPRDYAPASEGGSILLGDHLYYIRQRPDDGVTVTSGNTMWEEVTGHSDLIVTSVTGGASRTLRTGLSTRIYLLAGQNGVFWMEPRPYPDSRQDLYYYHAVDGKTYVHPDYRGGSNLAPVEYHGRLYWYLCDSSGYASSDVHWNPDRLVSANLDGSGQRDLYAPARVKRAPLFWDEQGQYLQLYQGRLFCLFRDSATGDKPDAEMLRHLCCLHPERAEPMEDLLTLPGMSAPFAFDQGYIYFTRQEQHRPLLDLLTGDDTHTETIQMLCRVPLRD